MRALRLQSGLSIPEVLFALMILMTASTATMAAVGSTKRNTAGAQRSQEATRIAQSTLDDMKGLEYAQLGLPHDLDDEEIPPLAADQDRFPDLESMEVGNGSNRVVEDLVQPSTGGSLNDGQGAPGQINPGPEVVTVNGGGGQGTSFLVYRYVTWKGESCFGAGAADECPAVYNRDHDLKRVLVAVLPGTVSAGRAVAATSSNSANATVWMSSLIADPNEAASRPCVGACVGSAAANGPRQSFYMTDVPCRESDIYNPYDTSAFPQSNHPTHRTSDWADGGWTARQGVASCRNAPNNNLQAGGPNNNCYNGTQLCKPDLLSISHPLEADCESDPTACPDAGLVRYSTDLFESGSGGVASTYGYGPFSRVVQKTPGCTYAAQPGSATNWSTSPANNAMVHTWATNKFEAADFANTNTTGFNIAGRISLDFYLGLFGSTVIGDNGRACISLIDRDEGTVASNTDPTAQDKIILEFTCASTQWPIGASSYFGKLTPASDYRGGKKLRTRQRCYFAPTVGVKNTFRSASDPMYGKVENFPAGGYKVAHNHRLLLRIAADADGSQNPLVFYYGYTGFPSSIQISTDSASDLVEDHLR